VKPPCSSDGGTGGSEDEEDNNGQEVNVPAAYPSVAESRDRLERAGWSVGATPTPTAWLVTGENGRLRLSATGQTPAEAWWNAALQARGMGRLAAPR
jgi:hypothetical protein